MNAPRVESHLFSLGPRSRLGGIRDTESRYAYINESARPSIERVRSFWEAWFERFPNGPKKVALRKGIQDDDHVHLSNFLEFFTFAMLTTACERLEIEPPVGTRTIDFRAQQGSLAFFAECSVSGGRPFDDQTPRLRKLLDLKASAYGPLDIPLLIVAGHLQMQFDWNLDDALLGNRLWLIGRSESVSQTRRRNGVLFDSKGPRNRAMSALLHGDFEPLGFMLPDRTYVLTHHPFAQNPLPLGLLPFAVERYIDQETGRAAVKQPATTVREFFGLPDGWPHYELDPDGES